MIVRKRWTCYCVVSHRVFNSIAYYNEVEVQTTDMLKHMRSCRNSKSHDLVGTSRDYKMNITKADVLFCVITSKNAHGDILVSSCMLKFEWNNVRDW